jgi:integrase
MVEAPAKAFTTSTPGLMDPRSIALRCPECGSERLFKDGFRYLADGSSVQRWLCRECNYRFSETHLNKMESKKKNDAHGKKVLAVEVEGAEEKGLSEKQEAGATQTSQRLDSKGLLVDFAWWMKKEGYAENTIVRRVKLLSVLAKRGADLFNPESVKETIAKQDCWNIKTKELAVEAYDCLLKMHGKNWNPPKYKPINKLPFIPTEQEIDQLIAGCNRKTAAFLQLLKETGARCGEAWRLQWIDVDFQNKKVRITPEKGGEPRAISITDKLISMLNTLPKDKSQIFNGNLRHFARSFRRQRTKIAFKLQNSRINNITFHTFRHWKATMEYYKTKDILHVMKMLGHKNINNTLLYTQLVNFESNEYHVATAKTVEEACKLAEAGFEYFTIIEGIQIFRKRK